MEVLGNTSIDRYTKPTDRGLTPALPTCQCELFASPDVQGLVKADERGAGPDGDGAARGLSVNSKLQQAKWMSNIGEGGHHNVSAYIRWGGDQVPIRRILHQEHMILWAGWSSLT